jgi:hypothetical protein
MADADLKGLVAQSGVSFVGTVEHAQSDAAADLPTTEQGAVVVVDEVLHAPPVLANLAGSRVTLVPSADQPALQDGQRAVFFANSLAYGETITLQELARRPVAQVASEAGVDAAAPGAGVRQIVADLEVETLQSHAAEVEAVILGRVTSLAKATAMQQPPREHDPDWWRATLEVASVAIGKITRDSVDVLYANSKDIQWHNAPKPRASQEGVWLLHSTPPELREVASYMIIDPLDYQPSERFPLFAQAQVHR